MKKIITFSLVLALMIGLGYADANSQNGKNQKNKSSKTTNKNQSKRNQCPNAKAKCPSDSTSAQCRGNHKGNGKQCRQGQKDCFIDKDKDGVNDNRCSGMGLGKRNCKNKCGKQK